MATRGITLYATEENTEFDGSRNWKDIFQRLVQKCLPVQPGYEVEKGSDGQYCLVAKVRGRVYGTLTLAGRGRLTNRERKEKEQQVAQLAAENFHRSLQDVETNDVRPTTLDEAGVDFDPTPIQELIGFDFENPELLKQAFIHSSFANEHGGLVHNERLEFLGDAFLGAYASVLVCDKSPNAREGDLTSQKARIVEQAACATYSEELGLNEYLLVGSSIWLSDERGNRVNRLGDMFEALLGAIYLDQGWDALSRFLDSHVRELMLRCLEGGDQGRAASDDGCVNLERARNALQEFFQQRGLELPEYRTGGIGPDHMPEFYATVLYEGNEIGVGRGPTKKEAQKAAAKNALDNRSQWWGEEETEPDEFRRLFGQED
eukprot:gb/GECG01015713.1/.p1 GENE.gb/GECG01015713.1/~~gb/GECG01015713.1/.p1  ORF type:complete len:375 (+),score=59.02 gb/GECG01015713.1/:1-1125(+)